MKGARIAVFPSNVFIAQHNVIICHDLWRRTNIYVFVELKSSQFCALATVQKVKLKATNLKSRRKSLPKRKFGLKTNLAGIIACKAWRFVQIAVIEHTYGLKIMIKDGTVFIHTKYL